MPQIKLERWQCSTDWSSHAYHVASTKSKQREKCFIFFLFFRYFALFVNWIVKFSAQSSCKCTVWPSWWQAARPYNGDGDRRAEALWNAVTSLKLWRYPSCFIFVATPLIYQLRSRSQKNRHGRSTRSSSWFGAALPERSAGVFYDVAFFNITGCAYNKHNIYILVPGDADVLCLRVQHVKERHSRSPICDIRR